MKTNFLVFAVVFSFVLCLSCTDNSTEDQSTLQTMTTDEVVSSLDFDVIVDDISSIAEDQFEIQNTIIARTSAPVKSILPACAKVSSILNKDIWTRTIDFGTQGCTLQNGSTVKGKIVISFSKSLGSKRTISYSLEGFYHNDNLVEGSKNIVTELKSSSLLAAIHPVNSHTVDIKVTFSDGKIYTRVGTRVREMVEGFATMITWEDNVFNITGATTTTLPGGVTYTSTIKSPLVLKMSCKMPFPVSGIIEIVKNKETGTLDYGKGDCDKLATFTTNGISKEIILKR